MVSFVSSAYACKQVSLASCMSDLVYENSCASHVAFQPRMIVESGLSDVLREETNTNL